jgi:hypothetical protein
LQPPTDGLHAGCLDHHRSKWSSSA